MVKLSSPFIKFAFQDETKLYIVSDFMQGGVNVSILRK